MARSIYVLFLHGILICGLSGCWATPLSRSYDDPYNAPLPNEPAPPSLSTRQEQCTRDPLSNCSKGAQLCKKDDQCSDGQICQRGLCTYPEFEVTETPSLADPEEEPES